MRKGGTKEGASEEGKEGGRQARQGCREGRQKGREGGGGGTSRLTNRTRPDQQPTDRPTTNSSTKLRPPLAARRRQQVYLGPHPAPVATVPGPVCGMGSARVRGPSPPVSRSHICGPGVPMPHPQPNDGGVRPSGCVGGCEAQKGKDCKCGTCYSWGQRAAGEPASKHPTELGVSSPDNRARCVIT